MLIVLLHLSTISVWIIKFDCSKEKIFLTNAYVPYRMEFDSV